MLKKLRIKFVLINMTIVTLMLCVIFSLIFYFTKSNLESQSLGMMQSIAADPFQLGSPNEYQASVRLPYFYMQISVRGEIVAVGGGYYDLSDQDFLEDLINTVFSSNERAGIIKEYNLRYYRVSKLTSQGVVFADISSELATLNNLIRMSLFLGAASFTLFLAVSLLLARWAVKPVDSAWKQQQQFVGDASHELKTPLTVIMTNAELLQQPEYSPEEKARFSASILTMSQQMRHLVEGLLELARADNGRECLSFQELDFSALVSDSLLPFEPVFYENALELDSQIENGILLRGSEQHLRQAVDILLDNARKYSDSPGRVSLNLQRQGKGHCLLTVSNPCGEMSKAELKDIFKRFYRADKARTRDGSYGLGLSIAERVVSMHKGRIWAEYSGGLVHFNISPPTE